MNRRGFLKNLSLIFGGIGALSLPSKGLAWVANHARKAKRLFCLTGYGVNSSYVSYDGSVWEQGGAMPPVPYTFGQSFTILSNSSIFCALGTYTGGSAISSDGVTWTVNNTLPAHYGEWGGTWNGSFFCAVNNDGSCVTSPDGLNWTSQTLPLSQSWGDVAWNGSKFCAIAYNSTTGATSPDGVTWTQVALPIAPVTGNGGSVVIESNGSLFCTLAADSNHNYVLTSADGSTWTQTTLPQVALGRDWTAACWNGTQFCALATTALEANGTCYSATSTDGLNWTVYSFSSSANSIDHVASSGSVFCAICAYFTNGGLPAYFALTSSDGINWTQQTLPADVYWDSLVWNGSVFCSVGTYYQGGNMSATSPDGVTWTTGQLPASDNYSAAPVWNGSKFCVIGGFGNSALSSDGLNWTAGNNLPPVTYNSWDYLAWNGSVFCALDSYQAHSATSTDGVSWTENSMPASDALYGGSGWSQITVVGNTFYACGYSKVASSTDGATWTVLGTALPGSGNLSSNGTELILLGPTVAATSVNGSSWTIGTTIPSINGPFNWSSITSAGSKFCAVGSAQSGNYILNVFATSTDGVTWAFATSSAIDYSVSSVAWNGTQFCALVDAYGSMLSSDGLTWSAPTAVPGYCFDITAKGSQFCASGNSDQNWVEVSSDGVHWTSGNIPWISPQGGIWLYPPVWNGRVFCSVSAGSGGGAATSKDGLVWTAQTLPVGNDYWTPVVWNGSFFLTLGVYGNVAKSPDGVNWTLGSWPSPESTGPLVWNGSMFLMGPGYGVNNFYTSTDGVNWTTQVAPAQSCSCIVYNGKICCAIFSGGGSYVSSDGVNWTAGNLSTNYSWDAVAWNGSVFCAVAYADLNNNPTNVGAISPDGLNWTLITLPASGFFAIQWNGEVFLALSASTTAATSPDGMHWTVQTAPVAGGTVGVS